MGTSPRGPDDSLLNSTSDFPRALAALEDAVGDLLSDGWSEGRRRRACEIAVALAQASKVSSWRETESIFRALASLLALSPAETLSIQHAVREKLLELLGLLKKYPTAHSA